MPSWEVITIGTVTVELSRSNLICSLDSFTFSSVSPILILANSFSEIASIKALSLVLPIDITQVGTESLSSNLSIISIPST